MWTVQTATPCSKDLGSWRGVTSLTAPTLAFTTWDQLMLEDCGNPIPSPQDYPDELMPLNQPGDKDDKRMNPTKFSRREEERGRIALPLE